jgi:hypothetical protein
VPARRPTRRSASTISGRRWERRRLPGQGRCSPLARLSRLALLGASCVLSALAPACSPSGAPADASAGATARATAASAADLPFVAVWRDDWGSRRTGQGPCLRVAIWNDGRAVVAEDPGTWCSPLRETTLDAADVADLKSRLGQTGVFELRGTCHLVPDAPSDCVLVRIGGRQRLLCWDEVETPGYGILADPERRHRDFITAWKTVNRLALGALTDASSASASAFALTRVPDGWRIEPPVASR